MITIEIYLFLAAVVAGAFVYMFLDLENRLYGNLFAAGFAAITAGLLSLWSFSQNLCVVSPVLLESVQVQHFNGSVLLNTTTQNTYGVFAGPIIDAPLGFLWLIVAVFMGIMCGYFAFEVLQEARNPSTEEDDE
jgi:hypothetical protein